ncbi:MAG: hypothetical protein C5B51_14785 [Terriglobia bacterium]|nr:MAG: hypothetical protein C5B51_14785 [Terriglobia bacterium]
MKTTTIFGVAEEAQALGYRTLALSNHLVAESLMVKMIARSAANGYGISEATRQKSWALQLGFEDDQAEAARQDYDAVLCEHHLEFIRSLESAALGTPETEVEKMLTGVRKSDLVIYLASNPVVASQRKGGPLGRDVAALGRMDNLLESRARECPNWFRVETVERESEAIVGDCFAAILQFAFRKSLIPDRSTWLCMTQSTDSIERSLE